MRNILKTISVLAILGFAAPAYAQAIKVIETSKEMVAEISVVERQIAESKADFDNAVRAEKAANEKVELGTKQLGSGTIMGHSNGTKNVLDGMAEAEKAADSANDAKEQVKLLEKERVQLETAKVELEKQEQEEKARAEKARVKKARAEKARRDKARSDAARRHANRVERDGFDNTREGRDHADRVARESTGCWGCYPVRQNYLDNLLCNNCAANSKSA